MKRNPGKKLLEKRLKECLTVEEMIKILQAYPPKTPVGAVGYFGEFMSLDDDSFHKVNAYLTANPNSWRDEQRITIEVIDIWFPDKGSDPD